MGGKKLSRENDPFIARIFLTKIKKTTQNKKIPNFRLFPKIMLTDISKGLSPNFPSNIE